jgi:queuine/archaeosine tRNA-ribosyltransferase
MRGIRESIEAGKFQEFKENFINEYNKGTKDDEQ